jgi:hypothetical protein
MAELTDKELKGLASGLDPVVESLADDGTISATWAADYCSFLELEFGKSNGISFWPWHVFQAVHFVSCHMPFRYGAWRQFTGRTNAATEALLGRLQFESELFLWDSVTRIPSFDNPSLLGDGVDDADVAVVNLCLGDTSVFAGNSQDDSLIGRWEHQYRRALAAVAPKWRSGSQLWKWLALGVRFASFIGGIAPMPAGDAECCCRDQPGLDPNRLQDTILRVEAHFPCTMPLGMVNLWLRASHLPRDSSGIPIALSSIAAPRLNVRTISETFLQSRRDQ